VALAFGEYIFDQERRELRRGDSTLKVDPLQLDLLGCFLANSGRLLSKQELLDQVWEGRAVADNVLSVTVAKLRKVLGHRPGEREYIENRYGRGYRFLVPVTTVESAPPRSSQPAPPLTISARTPTSPLVGRVESMQRLKDALARTLAGTGSLCVLIGEPGIGKTRLAESLEHIALGQGANPVWGRYQPVENAPPLWPFVQALRELNTEGLASEILRFLEERTAEHEKRLASSETASGLTHEFAYEASSHSHRTVDETTQALIRLSKHRPLVILLDDLQWADSMSLRLLNYLVDDIARLPLLVVATLRSTDGATESSRNRDLSRLLRHRNCERIELARLHESDISEYVSAVFGRGLAEISRLVFTRSEGNPFFMVELLRPWEGRSGPIDPEQLQLSGLAQGLLRQRVQALPEDSRKVLSAAAVIGHDFDLGLLGHVSERSPDELLEALDGSLANDTVIPSPELAGAYAFDHELIREVLYADLPVKERCRLHLRAGDGLARRRAAGGEVSSSELAHHFLSALPQGDVANAVEHARNAALAAHRASATVQARALLRRALASLSFWVEPNPEVRAALLLELSMVERALADAEYVGHLAQGVELAREHGFGALLTVAGQFLSPAPGILAQRGAADVLTAAAEVLSLDDDRRRAIVLAHLAWTAPNCNSARKVNALLQEAEERAQRSNAVDALAAVRDAKLFFNGGPKTVKIAEAIAAEIDRDVRALPPGMRRGRSLSTEMFRLISAMQRGDKPAMKRALDSRDGILATLNSIELNWHHERHKLVLRMNQGDLKGVEQDMARLRARAQRFRFQAWRDILSLDYGTLLLRTTDTTEFGARVRPSLAISNEDGPFSRSRKLRSMADFGLVDDLRQALAAVSVESLHDLPGDRDYLMVLCNFARACTVAGNAAQCRALYELLSPYPEHYAVDISFHCDGSVSHYLARLAQSFGNDEDARTHYEVALVRNAEFGLLPCEAQTRFELGSLLVDSARVRDVDRGRALLEQTRDAATAIGMQPLASAAARKLQQA
jgi:DNA-binding winged helix-turn-helix (wHTH) protein